MSAISGIYHRDGSPVSECIHGRMIDSLAHRGPDGKGSWCIGSIGMAHRMLKTTPESLYENLPWQDDSRRFTITADARIDNRQDLIASLSLSQECVTDSQLILAAFARWGEQCADKLIGDFAFVIWDSQEEKLFCARDHMGVKPFYYYDSKKIFAFGSEIKSIFCIPSVSCQINEAKIADFLAAFFEDQTSTFYHGIFRLPPAHYALVTREKTEVRQYWTFDPNHELVLANDDEYAEAFSEIFQQAVACRLRSAYPCGSTLSGGLDSSSIACTARNLLMSDNEKHLHTFSAIFPGLPEEDLIKIDERKYINAVLSCGSFKPHFVLADHLNPLMDLDQAMWCADEPIAGPNLYMHRALYKLAQKCGVRVFLDGIDGDTTVSHGWEYLPELARKIQWVKLYVECRALASRARVNRTTLEAVWRFGIYPLIPEKLLHWKRKIRNSNGHRYSLHWLVRNDFAEKVGLPERIKAQAPGSNWSTSARESHLKGFTHGLNAHGMQQLDNTTAGHTLEGRYPFFDRRLMAFCLALPPQQKIKMGWTRMVLRRSMEGVLPPIVQWRAHKANLGPNLCRKLIEFNRNILDDLFGKQRYLIEPYVDMDKLCDLYNRYTQNPTNTQDAVNMYQVVSLSQWMNRIQH